MKKVVDGIFAGLMISLGGAVFLACYPQQKVVGAVLFCVGLLCVCWKGYSLYTGKIGLVLEKHSKEDISVLFLGLLGNAIATIVAGYLLAYAIPNIKTAAVALCEAKLEQGYLQDFIRAVFCGILIYLAVDIFKTQNKTPLGVLLCIPAFILSGYEHSIADMFYFAASGIASGKTVLFIFLIVLGNSVGGLVIPVISRLSKLDNLFKKSAEPKAALMAEAAADEDEEK